MSGKTATAPPDTDLPRRMLPPAEIAQRFTAWLRDEGYTGWHLAKDIPEALAQFCAGHGLVRPASDMFLAAFAQVPGVESHRMRLAGVTDVILVALRRRAKMDRPALYRVLEDVEMAAVARPQPAKAGKPVKRSARAPAAGRRGVEMPERLAA